MYSIEEELSPLIQGRDFEFQMYGGTLLDSLCFIKEGNDEEEEYKKLVSMFSFSRNAFVMIDSDAVLNEDKGIIDKSKFKNAKAYIKKEFVSLSNFNRGLGLWYKEGDISVRTMESYLDVDSIKLIESNSWTKKIASQKVTESWGSSKKLEDFPNNLLNEIRILSQTIEEWNK